LTLTSKLSYITSSSPAEVAGSFSGRVGLGDMMAAQGKSKWTSAAEGEDWAEEDAQAGSGLKDKIREQILAFKASKERGVPAEWAEDDDFIPMNKNAEEDKAAAAAAEEVLRVLLLHSCCTGFRLL
jgi:hypothetical protein